MKTKGELNALKEEIETLNRKLAELTEKEMRQVASGIDSKQKNYHQLYRCLNCGFWMDIMEIKDHDNSCPVCGCREIEPDPPI